MTKRDEWLLRLERTAAAVGVATRDAIRLHRAAQRAFRAGERAASEDRPGVQEAADKADAAFEKLAASLGLGVIWPGLWPVLVKDGREHELPSSD